MEGGKTGKLTDAKPLIAGYTYNEPAAFLAFDPNATSPPAPTVPGTEGLACGITREVL